MTVITYSELEKKNGEEPSRKDKLGHRQESETGDGDDDRRAWTFLAVITSFLYSPFLSLAT